MAGKKDAINIAPFVDILLVLFVVILVSATFSDVSESKIKELKKKVQQLQDEKDSIRKSLERIMTKGNEELKSFSKEVALLQKNLNEEKKENQQLKKRIKKLKKELKKSSILVSIEEDGFFNINGTRLSPEHMAQFIKLFRLDLSFTWPKRPNANVRRSLMLVKRVYQEIGGKFYFQ